MHSTPACSQRYTQTVTVWTQTDLETSQGPGLSSVAPRTVLHVVALDHVRQIPAVCHSSASLWRESCWGAYVLCDAWLHWQTYAWPCIYTNSNPPCLPHRMYNCTHSPNHLEITTNTRTCMHAHQRLMLPTWTYMHWLRPARSHLDLLLNQIAVSPAARILPAASTAEATIP